MTKFRVGDTVTCVKPGKYVHLGKGEHYKVVSCGCKFVTVRGATRNVEAYHHRFRLASNSIPNVLRSLLEKDHV